ncbi:MAG: NAD-binding protein [Armatimonadetes bacterium]|nr:NAD-binding protein [Armatimonadota bacterium]MDE2206835.1 NAD-binding protein [Armatimonadota bacterium]
MYVIIVGAGNVGYYLAKTLAAAHHEVLLLEKDRPRYRTVSEELGEIVMQGDGCEVAQQQDAGFARADVVVAVTGSDDDNLVVCQMAKMEHRVPRTISRVNDPRNEVLFKELGIDATVSSTKIIYNLIEQEVGGGEVIPLAALQGGNIEIVEIEISNRSPVADRPVADLALPKDALIVCVIRDTRAVLPSPETVVRAGDSVIALVNAELEHELRDLFAETVRSGS